MGSGHHQLLIPGAVRSRAGGCRESGGWFPWLVSSGFFLDRKHSPLPGERQRWGEDGGRRLARALGCCLQNRGGGGVREGRARAKLGVHGGASPCSAPGPRAGRTPFQVSLPRQHHVDGSEGAWGPCSVPGRGGHACTALRPGNPELPQNREAKTRGEKRNQGTSSMPRKGECFFFFLSKVLRR